MFKLETIERKVNRNWRKSGHNEYVFDYCTKRSYGLRTKTMAHIKKQNMK